MLIKDGPRWSWQGAVAVTLALGIFVTIVLICTGMAYKLSRGLPLAPVAVNFLTATLSSLVGAVATFLGKVARPPDEHHGPGAVIDQPVFTTNPDDVAGLDVAPTVEDDTPPVPRPGGGEVAQHAVPGDDDTVRRPVVPNSDEGERP